jgi:putative protease
MNTPIGRPHVTLREPQATTELLAPAGGFDALRAAVRNGADAVYLGTTELNARRGAQNFTLETLPDACDYAHLRGARIYLTANVVVLESEMRSALAMIARAWEAGVDAVIVQDLGLLRAIAASLPEVRIHSSTQIDAHNVESILALAEMGVSRITLARELSVSELGQLVAASPVELESFAHGSLCFCHSGQCFMSSLVGGRSANRGLCAQPCRLPYDLVDENGVVAEVPGRYLLSPKDLCGIDLLPGLVSAGVAALKIEGRMKSPEYVASVVSVYRAALDRAMADTAGYAVLPVESERLEEAFNRGFTQGYLADIRDDRLMSYTRPNNRGVPLGRVSQTAPGHASIVLDRALESADTIEFWTAAGRFAQAAGPLVVKDVPSAAAPAGATVTVAVDKSVRPGDRVFRVVNAALTEAARRSWQSTEERNPVPIGLKVTLRVGQPAVLEVSAPEATVQVTGAIVEAARTKSLTPDDVIEHVGRLGGTPYASDDIAVHLDAGVGMGFSTLHALRRQALEQLDLARLEPWAGRSLPESPRPPALRPAEPHTGRPTLVVVARTAAAARACKEAGADRVLIACEARVKLPAGVEARLPRVVHEHQLPGVLECAHGSEGVAVSGNLGVVRALGAKGSLVEADWGLNVVNPWSAAALSGIGATGVWASPELSGRQIASLVQGSPVPVGVVVGGRMELMVAEHCVLQAVGPCDHRCAGCARRRGAWVLRDRKGYDMPVTTDSTGIAHLYNAVPLDLSRAIPELIEAGVSALRLDLETYGQDEAVAFTRAWRQRLDTAWKGGESPDSPIVEPTTSAHFFRGLR